MWVWLVWQVGVAYRAKISGDSLNVGVAYTSSGCGLYGIWGYSKNRSYSALISECLDGVYTVIWWAGPIH